MVGETSLLKNTENDWEVCVYYLAHMQSAGILYYFSSCNTYNCFVHHHYHQHNSTLIVDTLQYFYIKLIRNIFLNIFQVHLVLFFLPLSTLQAIWCHLFN